MNAERPQLPCDVCACIETARSIGADEAELAALLSKLRERAESELPLETMEATLVYAMDLAQRVAKIVEAHQHSLPLEVIAASRRLRKEIEWIEQDLARQHELCLGQGNSKAA
jgi:ADP-dependent phosphofructokinase/glucokinase